MRDFEHDIDADMAKYEMDAELVITEAFLRPTARNAELRLRLIDLVAEAMFAHEDWVYGGDDGSA